MKQSEFIDPVTQAINIAFFVGAMLLIGIAARYYFGIDIYN